MDIKVIANSMVGMANQVDTHQVTLPVHFLHQQHLGIVTLLSSFPMVAMQQHLNQ
jgi:hypothetical protein